MAKTREMVWTATTERAQRGMGRAVIYFYLGAVTLVAAGVGVKHQDWAFAATMGVFALGALAVGLWVAFPRATSNPIVEVYDAWGAWALAHGMTFVDGPAGLTLPTTATTVGSPLQPITHAAQGTFGGAQVTTMLLGYTTSKVSGKYPPNIETVLAAHTKTKYPPVTVMPRRGPYAAAAAMGTDVLTESNDFNTRYRVVSADVETAHAVLQPRVIERLLAWDRDTKVVWDGNSIILSQKGLVGDASNLDAHLALLEDLSEMVLGFQQVEPEGASQLRHLAPVGREPVTAGLLVAIAGVLMVLVAVVAMQLRAWNVALILGVPGVAIVALVNVSYARRRKREKDASERSYYTDQLD